MTGGRTGGSQAALATAKTDKGVMGKAARKAEALLKEMVSLTLRPDLTRIQRTNLETCITVHMHQKESTGSNPRPFPPSPCPSLPLIADPSRLLLSSLKL